MSIVGSITEVDAYTASVPTPGSGTPVLAADVIAGEQALANRTKYFKNSPTFDGTISVGVNAGLTGVLTVTGATICNGAVTLANTTTVTGGHSFEVQGYELHPDFVDLDDNDHTLDLTTGGQRIRMINAPAANRVLTLKQTTTSNRPPDRYWFEVLVMNVNQNGFGVKLKREGSSDAVANLGTGSVAADNQPAWVRVVKQAGIWRLAAAGMNCFNAGDS